MTTVEAWQLIADKLKDTSDELNKAFVESGNFNDRINLSDYETIDDVFKNLKFTDEEMV